VFFLEEKNQKTFVPRPLNQPWQWPQSIRGRKVSVGFAIFTFHQGFHAILSALAKMPIGLFIRPASNREFPAPCPILYSNCAKAT
jgi:hypothetical protein